MLERLFEQQLKLMETLILMLQPNATPVFWPNNETAPSTSKWEESPENFDENDHPTASKTWTTSHWQAISEEQPPQNSDSDNQISGEQISLANSAAKSLSQHSGRTNNSVVMSTPPRSVSLAPEAQSAVTDVKSKKPAAGPRKRSVSSSSQSSSSSTSSSSSSASHSSKHTSTRQSSSRVRSRSHSPEEAGSISTNSHTLSPPISAMFRTQFDPTNLGASNPQPPKQHLNPDLTTASWCRESPGHAKPSSCSRSHSRNRRFQSRSDISNSHGQGRGSQCMRSSTVSQTYYIRLTSDSYSTRASTNWVTRTSYTSHRKSWSSSTTQSNGPKWNVIAALSLLRSIRIPRAAIGFHFDPGGKSYRAQTKRGGVGIVNYPRKTRCLKVSNYSKKIYQSNSSIEWIKQTVNYIQCALKINGSMKI